MRRGAHKRMKRLIIVTLRVGVGIGIGVAIGNDIEQHRDDSDCDSDPDSDSDPDGSLIAAIFETDYLARIMLNHGCACAKQRGIDLGTMQCEITGYSRRIYLL